MEWLFWIALAVITYTYIGYGLLVGVMVTLRDRFKKTPMPDYLFDENLPDVTLVIAAFNEVDIIREKIINTKRLRYPADKLRVLFITDGSTDQTHDVIELDGTFDVTHRPERRGKTAALNRAVKLISSPVVVFTDANTILDPSAIRNLVAPYADPGVGAVAGEKRVGLVDIDKAHGAGEGLYWRYESKLKEWDSKLFTVVGAAGELFSVRTHLIDPVEEDTILDDFMISLRVVEKGFRVSYRPDAFAFETPSASLSEEMKRKFRICAGGFQSIGRLKGMLNFVRRPVAAFQYVSHRLLRWAVTPFLLPILFGANLSLAMDSTFYLSFLICQLGFYLFAGYGYLRATKGSRSGLVFVPLYFLLMNVAAYIGLARHIRGTQSASWSRARRAVTA